MSALFEKLLRAAQTPAGRLDLLAAAVITLCVVIVFGAVFINFAVCHRRQGVKQEQKSLVATGSMTLFFLFFYGLIHLRLGEVPVGNPTLRVVLMAAGLIAIVCGCGVNVAGRLRLGRNWANQATIYDGQRLVTSGIYALVRHPLYASLIWMFYGASIVYANAAAALANSLIFLPFMYHRARLEEELLAREFKDYAAYRRRVGMFFFKPFHSRFSFTPGRHRMTPDACTTDQVAIPKAAFAFCRYSMALLIWLAFLLKLKLLVAVLFALLVLSALLTVRYAPLVWLYSMTLQRLAPSGDEFLSRAGMRLAHSLGAVFAALCLLFLYSSHERIGWGLTFGYCLVKTVSAIWACPVYKLYACMQSGNCCTFLKKRT